MGIFGAPDVDWNVAMAGGRLDVAPGGTVNATISLRPKSGIDARKVMAAVVGVEEYDYNEKEIHATDSSTNRTTGTSELFRREVQLLGPGQIGGGEAKTASVQIPIPADALPSFETKILRVKWTLRAWVDVGGRDPETEQRLIVPLTTAQLNPADAATMGEQVQVAGGAGQVSFWAQPAPLRAGAPFSGAIDTAAAIDLGSAHLELKLNVQTRMSGGVPGATLLAIGGLSSSAQDGINDSQILWRGSLTGGGTNGAWHRSLFSGQVPLEPIVTAIYPHGAATALLDLVTSKRLRPDAHLTRPVAIVTG
jgi:hypothetical protein